MSATPATQDSRFKIQNRVRKPPLPIEAWQRARLFGYWKDLSKSLTFEGDERQARLDYAGEKLGHPVESWSKLTKAEAGKLIHAMRADLGRDQGSGIRDSGASLTPNPESRTPRAKPDALEICAKLALDLYGPDWYAALSERLTLSPFFHYGKLDEITPWQSHELIEILFDHLERKLFPDDAPMETRHARKEEMRKRFAKRR